MTDTPFIRPDMKAFLEAIAAMAGPTLAEMTLEEARASYVALHGMADRPARELAVIRNLSCPGPAGDIPLRLYDARESREAGPVITFYHGGGFVIGDLDTHHNLCTEIAALMDLPVVAVDYRLAPEHPFPAAIEDCEAATRWVASSPSELGRTASGVIPIGDSAGGNATIVVSQLLGAKPADVPVVLQVPIFPLASDAVGSASLEAFAEGFVLTKASIEFFDTAYKADRADPRGFPILGDHTAAPPTIVATASLDPIRDSGRDYAKALVEAGRDVVYLEMEGVTHSFTNIRAAVPSTQGDLERIIAAMKMMLGTA
ncbi:lipase [Erythrobacter longus]|uniref:Lipase n=2 Tax=Erythrobacter longus TaxID=1044 RepID=A0A074MDU6_ERYLO|nr:alpha/beta hydrolase [Erythrobacter longus]7CIP_A Chain A, Lipase [Erythrobacter longus]7CIP_B Chain B, Lipase [Erythrobacter longus]7CIP_C Chain C, Lipase [Erythrobacter longus]7CIP_D Chain D, Lipase [Erythrobacter longus]7W8N_A Chain A, Lipase [Erythrobacter longus]7W8N_B Chain B, Lipase [Erythrobacter longus]7W8N_D Chain D, Lipase [Erythrobacter longus]KEO91609.1 lipase [Erythrobacter longus]